MLHTSLMTNLMTRRALAGASGEVSASYGELEGTLRNTEVIEAMGMLGPLARRWQSEQQRIAGKLDRAGRTGRAFSSASRAGRTEAPSPAP